MMNYRKLLCASTVALASVSVLWGIQANAQPQSFELKVTHFLPPITHSIKNCFAGGKN